MVFKRCNFDHSVFVLKRETCVVVLIVYVGDIIVSSSDVAGIKEVKDYFKNTSRTKDLRLLHYFLGLEVPHGRGEIVLSKRKYVLELLNEIDMLGEKPVDTPMEQNVNLNGDDSLVFSNKSRYRSLVGKLFV